MRWLVVPLLLVGACSSSWEMNVNRTLRTALHVVRAAERETDVRCKPEGIYLACKGQKPDDCKALARCETAMRVMHTASVVVEQGEEARKKGDELSATTIAESLVPLLSRLREVLAVWGVKL